LAGWVWGWRWVLGRRESVPGFLFELAQLGVQINVGIIVPVPVPVSLLILSITGLVVHLVKVSLIIQ
jgi:hypothetical protein